MDSVQLMSMTDYNNKYFMMIVVIKDEVHVAYNNRLNTKKLLFELEMAIDNTQDKLEGVFELDKDIPLEYRISIVDEETTTALVYVTKRAKRFLWESPHNLFIKDTIY